MINKQLLRHLLMTYFNQRVGMAFLAFIFPFFLWFVGETKDIQLQDSMSAYYHQLVNGESMRDWFVGFLCAIGVFLYLYKGFGKRENIALNIAGICAVGVAMVPMAWECGDDCPTFTWHGAFAISLFFCLAYVCICLAKDSLKYLKNPGLVNYYRWLYNLLGLLMIGLPVSAFLVLKFAGQSWVVFAIEASGVCTFAAYWTVKSVELSLHFEERVISEQAAENKDSNGLLS